MSLDLSETLRAAIIADATIIAELPAYKGSYPVFTRIPVPDDAAYPMITIPDEVGAVNEDGVDFLMPAVVRDVNVYGSNEGATTYEQVRTIADAVWELFHRQQRGSINLSVTGWDVVDVRAARPRPAPVDDPQQTVGRRVELTVRLAKKL